MVLFEKFKLKVIEAEARGMDKDPSFMKELEGYRKQLVRPYMADKEMDDRLIDETINRPITSTTAGQRLLCHYL